MMGNQIADVTIFNGMDIILKGLESYVKRDKPGEEKINLIEEKG